MQSHVLDALAYAEIMYRRNLINQEKDMGCDIHFVVEVDFARGYEGEVPRGHVPQWVGVYSTGHTPNMARNPDDMYNWRSVWCDERDYAFFAAIAGVRGEGPKPNGIPEDASELARMYIDQYGCDGHSYGHMPLLDFVRAKMRVRADEVTAAEVTHKLTSKADVPADVPAYAPSEFALADLSAYQKNSVRVVFFFDD